MPQTGNTKFKLNRYAAPVGVVVLIFAVIGVISVIVGSINFTRGILDNTKEKQKFERLIRPIVMLDPPEIESPQNLDPLMLLESSIWSALQDMDRDAYTYDDIGRIMVPQTDVDLAASKLYGSQIQLEHKSFSDYDVNYIYDDQLSLYYVPTQVNFLVYSPRVEKISKKGDVLQLRVGYIPPTSWTMDFDGNKYEPPAEKYRIYEMKKEKGNYVLVAIRNEEGDSMHGQS